jgi:tight adherence protein B
MNPWLIGLIFLPLFAAMLVAISLGGRFLEEQSRRRVKGILRAASGEEAAAPEETSILVEQGKEDPLTALLAESKLPGRMASFIQQAGLDWSVTRLAVTTFAGFVIGLILGWKFEPLGFQALSALGFGLLLGSLPYVYVRHERNKRLREFEEQFPDALDFLARSMRAGHAFTISLDMMGQESPDPVGQEFRTLFNEQNLGAPIETALENFGRRVPILDVRLFISTVLLQRQTGGNLSEVLVRLGYIIRERFRLKGHVRAVSAHGRLTALILSILPIALVLGLMLVAPGYLKELAADPDGKWMIAGSIVGQILAYFIMRRIINIKI